MIPLIGLVAGLLIGLLIPYEIPQEYSVYAAVVILAVLDSVFGGYLAAHKGTFCMRMFFSGIIGNALIALLLAYIGEKMNVPLYYAAIFVFGSRIFNNFSAIRRSILERIDSLSQSAKDKRDRKKKDSTEEKTLLSDSQSAEDGDK